jgi:subtilisin family serine protease
MHKAAPTSPKPRNLDELQSLVQNLIIILDERDECREEPIGKTPPQTAPGPHVSPKQDFLADHGRLHNDPEFRNSYLIMPRDDPEGANQEYTYSAAAAARSPRERPLVLKQPKRIPSEVLVKVGLVDVEKFQPNCLPSERDVPRFGQGIFTRQPALGMAAAYFRSETAEKEARKALDSEFEFVPNFPVSIPLRVPVDRVSATRGLAPLEAQEWPEDSGIAKAHKSGVRGAGVLVGVVDTGIDADHKEFSHFLGGVPFRYVPLFPKDVPPRDIRGFDTEGHGTHVCGILAGKSVGVAPEVSLSVAAVIESETTYTSLARVTFGLDWVMQQFSRVHVGQSPAVLSMSLGFPPQPADVDANVFKLWVRVTKRLLSELRQANVLPVVAIGNEGPDTYRYPGVLEEVLGIGAVDFEGQVAAFSGSARPPDLPAKPDLVGYGVGVYSSVERDYVGRSAYQRFNGTSMATPYVAGIAALYRCRHPAASVDEITTMLRSSAKKLQGPADRVGAGLARFE